MKSFCFTPKETSFCFTPKEKPTAAGGGGTPKENPTGFGLEESDGVGVFAPNENGAAAASAGAGALAAVSTSCPGLAVSHDKHLVKFKSLYTEQVPHFHLCFWNMFSPHEFDVSDVSDLDLFEGFSLGLDSSSPSLSTVYRVCAGCS